MKDESSISTAVAITVGTATNTSDFTQTKQD
jgi:hypothetical protein